jgi:hypothetical protein
MIRILVQLSIGVIFLSACNKQLETTSKHYMLEPVASNSVHAVPINQTATFPIATYIYNDCNVEYVYIEGTVHYKVSGMVSANKITYVLHYNYAGVTGIGLTSGRKYIAGGSFNYSNTENFDDQFVYQQNASFNYISVTGGESFKIINDWHLTVTATGVATFFFTTNGDVLTCI